MKQREEEENKHKELEEKEMKKMEQFLNNQASSCRLADYFVTIGVDDYHTEEEMREIPSIRNPQSIITQKDQEKAPGITHNQQEEEASHKHIQ